MVGMTTAIRMAMPFGIIQGRNLVASVIGLVIFGLICWLLFWLIDYCAMPEPVNKVAKVIVALAIVLVLINFLLTIVGQPFISW